MHCFQPASQCDVCHTVLHLHALTNTLTLTLSHTRPQDEASLRADRVTQLEQEVTQLQQQLLEAQRR